MQGIYIKLGQRIRQLREEAGFTQEELAEAISLSRTSITNIERGRQKIQIHTLYEIAATLGKEVSMFLPEVMLEAEPGVWERIPDDVNEKDRHWIQDVISQSETEG